MFSVITTNDKTPWMEDKHSQASVIKGRDSRLERTSKLWSRCMSEETRPYRSSTVVKRQSQKARSHTHKHNLMKRKTVHVSTWMAEIKYIWHVDELEAGRWSLSALLVKQRKLKNESSGSILKLFFKFYQMSLSAAFKWQCTLD